MKKLLFFAIFLTISLSYSQNIETLDKKNGFKNFKFNSSKKSYENIVETGRKVRKATEYLYMGNDILKIENVKINKIHLYFYEDKLCSISLSFGDYPTQYSKNDYDQVNYALENTFGVSEYTCEPAGNSVSECGIWVGKKVRLEHNRYSIDNFYYGYIIIEDILLKQKLINSNF